MMPHMMRGDDYHAVEIPADLRDPLVETLNERAATLVNEKTSLLRENRSLTERLEWTQYLLDESNRKRQWLEEEVGKLRRVIHEGTGKSAGNAGTEVPVSLRTAS